MFTLASLKRQRAALLFASLLGAALAAFGWYSDRGVGATVAPVRALPPEMARDRAPIKVRHFAHWTVHTRDHAGLPFLVLDKAGARLYAFDATGRLEGSAPVLLGAERGDAPHAAATPAGRFVAEPAPQPASADLVWLGEAGELRLRDPQASLAPGRALERLASDAPEDRRITDGSLHVPPAFFEGQLASLRGRASVLYVLPEEGPVQQVLGGGGRGTAEERKRGA